MRRTLASGVALTRLATLPALQGALRRRVWASPVVLRRSSVVVTPKYLAAVAALLGAILTRAAEMSLPSYRDVATITVLGLTTHPKLRMLLVRSVKASTARLNTAAWVGPVTRARISSTYWRADRTPVT